jgi:hypothetical protein
VSGTVSAAPKRVLTLGGVCTRRCLHSAVSASARKRTRALANWAPKRQKYPNGARGTALQDGGRVMDDLSLPKMPFWQLLVMMVRRFLGVELTAPGDECLRPGAIMNKGQWGMTSLRGARAGLHAPPPPQPRIIAK